MRVRTTRRTLGVASVVVCGTLTTLPLMIEPAQAGILSRLRQAISSLWGQKSDRQDSAQGARAQASALQQRAETVHDRLERMQQAWLQANENYYNYWRQMKRTEAQIVTTRHRVQIVTARYKRHRKLFGQRLAAMQRTGKLGYLQFFLSARTLSDLTRRSYFFNVLTTRDAALQAAIQQDKQELEQTQNTLMAQWHERNRLQLAANRERLRVASARSEQQRLLYQINHSRYAALSYAAAQEQSAREIEGMIGELMARRSAIIQSYEEQAARRRAYRRFYRRYHRRRVARRVTRVRYARSFGGELKPMPIQEVIYRDEMVPLDSGGLSDSFDSEDGHQHSDDWSLPVRGRMSSRFGIRRHPILRRRRMHTGDDLAARYGTPIKAARSGRVLWAGWKKAYGNTVIVDNGDGVTTLYAHASKVGVKPGQPIKSGEYIGNVGSTGWSTGSHLHFEVRKNGKPIDPSPYLRRGRRKSY
ncbi:MAG: peptidoglycan DD-metalloendopeptidase family protein [Armatimonadota bacterium]|nr:peptidoglycan DD-metalloendopeptidase family protein [Armatimonadota bacterium]